MDGSVSTFIAKLERIVEDSLQLRDASEKERRLFSTDIQENLVDIIRDYRGSGPQGNCTTGLPVNYSLTNSPGIFTAVCNYILSGVYEMVESPHHERLVAIKLSTRTLVNWSDGKKVSMKESWCRVHRELSPGGSNFAVDFNTAAAYLAQQSGYTSLPPNPTRTMDVFLEDLCTLVENWEGLESKELWSQVQLIKEKNPRRPCLLALRERFYISRGDYRAFIVDTDMVRSFVGACIQAINQPKSVRRRNCVWTSAEMPVENKDKLDIHLYCPSGYTLTLMFGDVSSFSANTPNGWALCLAQLLLLRGPFEYLDKPFIVTVQGYPFEVRYSDMLLVYLYLTVFTDAQDESKGELYTCLGGYLGVSGNMTITLFAFCLCHHLLKRELDTLRKTQVGGDDFLQCFIGSANQVEQDIQTSLTKLQKSQGRIRDTQLISIEGLKMGWNKCDAEFCKKSVWIRKTRAENGYHIHVATEPSLPIPGHLFDDYSSLMIKEKNEKFQECIRSVRMGAHDLQDKSHLLSFVAKLFIRLHYPMSQCVPVSFLKRWEKDFTLIEGLMLSLKAEAKARKVKPISSSNGGLYRVDIRSQVTFLLSSDQLTAVDVLLNTSGELPSSLVLTKQERASLQNLVALSLTITEDVSEDQLTKAIALIESMNGEN